MSDPRPHILYVAEYSTGGSVESLLTLVGGLDKNRYRPTVLFYRTPDAEISERVEQAARERCDGTVESATGRDALCNVIERAGDSGGGDTRPDGAMTIDSRATVELSMT